MPKEKERVEMVDWKLSQKKTKNQAENNFFPEKTKKRR